MRLLLMLVALAAVAAHRVAQAQLPQCAELPATALQCAQPDPASCAYGANVTAACTASAACEGNTTVTATFVCAFCYQLDSSVHRCDPVVDCASTQSYNRYATTCTVADTTFCLGARSFTKYVPCDWTSGVRYWTALAFSIFLGGFAADRFYLGYYGWAVFKLLTLGGLGVWTLIDVVLVGSGYLGPANGSLYYYQ